MPVTPYCNQLFQTRQNLYQFLSNCQKISIENNELQIVSISLEIQSLDPLAVLHEIARPDQVSFYFEKQDLADLDYQNSQKVAIAAINSATQLRVEGVNRFSRVKAFIQSTLSNIIMAGDLHLPFSGPHFFCSFSFLDHQSQSTSGGFSAATVFLPSWQISCVQNRGILVANLAIDGETYLESTVDTLWQTIQSIRAVHYQLVNPHVHQQELLQQWDVVPTENFQQAVGSALNSIRAKQFNKIVLAHAVDVASPLPFHRNYSLNNLRQVYPDCYIFSISNGLGQHFIGASPERLVSLRDRQLMTDALAGSAPRGKTTYEDSHLANALLNSAKEIHEHRVVVDFITHRLAQLQVRSQPAPQRLLQLSNIQHLHTPIRATVPADVHLLDIVAELHPTPAVAGMPRAITCEQIQRYESFERSLYAAPIGWVNHKGDGEFAVGIRSALINGVSARLFAGAGIVAGSDPARELAEVRLKLQALLAALV